MAVGEWLVHDKTKKYIGDKTVDLSSDTFIMALCSSSSNAGTLSIDALSTLTNELSGNGYSRQTLTGVSWTESAGVATFDCDSTVFTASGGDIVARYAVIFDDSVSSPVAKPIVASCLLDNAPGDVTATDGNTFTVKPHANGLFTVS